MYNMASTFETKKYPACISLFSHFVLYIEPIWSCVEIREINVFYLLFFYNYVDQDPETSFNLVKTSTRNFFVTETLFKDIILQNDHIITAKYNFSMSMF